MIYKQIEGSKNPKRIINPHLSTIASKTIIEPKSGDAPDYE